MVDAMKEIMDIIKQMPELAIWVLAGLLFYKVVIIGSWFGIARLVIIKLYDGYSKPRTTAPSLQPGGVSSTARRCSRHRTSS